MYVKIRITIIILLCCFVLTSCTDQIIYENQNDKKSGINIAVLIYRDKDTFMSTMREYIEEYAQELSAEYDLNLNVSIVDADNEQKVQNNQLKEFIDQDYDVLCVNIVDRTKAAHMIDMARSAETPIVFFNREPVRIDMSRWKNVYYVGSKAEESGTLQGKMVIEYWENHPELDKNKDGKMQCVFFCGEPNHQDSILRTEYNLKAFQSSDIVIETLATYTANWQRELAKSKMDVCLKVYGNEIEMIICNNDDMALGAIDSMKQSGSFNNKDLIPTFGIDATPIAQKSVLENELKGTVLNDGRGQAKGVLDTALALSLGQDVNEKVPNLMNGKYYWVPYQKFSK